VGKRLTRPDSRLRLVVLPRNSSGIGPVKAEKYGARFLELLAGA
jgi:hypothetical protein